MVSAGYLKSRFAIVSSLTQFLISMMTALLLALGGPGAASGAGILRQEASLSPFPDPGVDWIAAYHWFAAQQQSDGGFPGPSGKSDVRTTVDAAIAEYALWFRYVPSDARSRTHSYLAVHGAQYANSSPGGSARLALAALALTEFPPAFGVDMLALHRAPRRCRLAETEVRDTARALLRDARSLDRRVCAFPREAPDLQDSAYIMIALMANEADLTPHRLVRQFRLTQAPNGGWARNGSSDLAMVDTQTTALVLQALALRKRPSWLAIKRGVAFLHTMQMADGGFAANQAASTTPDAISTALVLQALVATRENPVSAEWGNVPGALAEYQDTSGGFRRFANDAGPDLSATLCAIPALVGKPLPARTNFDLLEE